ncbi:hypothetical protein CRUP_009585 [Coryphaenoides rupestris]|nr:hypothetical protein CRUP_009585 [Coryphaenoides rupestris]
MDKIKEMSMLSLICSCFHTPPRPTVLAHDGDVGGQTKSANKRASSQSFEVYLEAPAKPSPRKPQSKTPLRKDLSMEELQKRLEAADDRRKQLAEKREHERTVLSKALELTHSFSTMAKVKLHHKMEVSKENRDAYLNALRQRLQEKEVHAAQVRRNKKLQSDYSG